MRSRLGNTTSRMRGTCLEAGSSSCSPIRDAGRLARLAGTITMVSLVAVTPAMAVDVLVHWRAGAGDLPAGYHLHVRTGSGHYEPARDVGMAQRRSDGTFETVVADLDPQTSYAFAIS